MPMVDQRKQQICPWVGLGCGNVVGFVVKEVSRIVSNYRADNNLGDWLDAAPDKALIFELVEDTEEIWRRAQEKAGLTL